MGHKTKVDIVRFCGNAWVNYALNIGHVKQARRDGVSDFILVLLTFWGKQRSCQ
jgi:hypothetical protein